MSDDSPTVEEIRERAQVRPRTLAVWTGDDIATLLAEVDMTHNALELAEAYMRFERSAVVGGTVGESESAKLRAAEDAYREPPHPWLIIMMEG